MRTKVDETVLSLTTLTITGSGIDITNVLSSISAPGDDSSLVTSKAVVDYVGVTLGNATKIQGNDVVISSLTDGDILKYNSTSGGWENVVANVDLENPPIEDNANSAPTSEWAYDHDISVNGVHGVAAGEIVGTEKNQTLTNKTYNNAEFTGVITGTGTEVGTLVGVSGKIPDAQAVKSYVDTEIANNNSINEADDTSISNSGDPLVTSFMIYDTTLDKWKDVVPSGGITSVGNDGLITLSSDVVTNDSSNTLTNKTVDAQGVGNSFSGFRHGTEVDQPATAHGVSGVIVGTTDTQTLSNKTLDSPRIDSGISGSSTGIEIGTLVGSALKLADAAAIKDYVDNQVTIASTLDGLTDTDINSPASGNLILWNGTDWENVTMGGDATIDSNGQLTLAASQRQNAEFFYLSNEFSCLSTSTFTIALPVTDDYFFINEIGVIVTDLSGAVITQPTLSFDCGDEIKSSEITDSLDAKGKREVYIIATSEAGEQGRTKAVDTEFTIDVDVAGDCNAVAQVTAFSFAIPTNVTADYDGQYFDLYIGTNAHRFWYDVDDSGTSAPSNPGALHEITTVTNADTVDQIASKTSAVIDAVTGLTSDYSTGSSFNITNDTAEDVANGTASNPTAITEDVTTEGQDKNYNLKVYFKGIQVSLV